MSPASQPDDRHDHHKLIGPAFAKFFTQAPQKLRNFLKVGRSILLFSSLIIFQFPVIQFYVSQWGFCEKLAWILAGAIEEA